MKYLVIIMALLLSNVSLSHERVVESSINVKVTVKTVCIHGILYVVVAKHDSVAITPALTKGNSVRNGVRTCKDGELRVKKQI